MRKNRFFCEWVGIRQDRIARNVLSIRRLRTRKSPRHRTVSPAAPLPKGKGGGGDGGGVNRLISSHFVSSGIGHHQRGAKRGVRSPGNVSERVKKLGFQNRPAYEPVAQTPSAVTLSEAKGLVWRITRFFAMLRMTRGGHRWFVQQALITWL